MRFSEADTAAAVGIEGRVSGHSLRVGGAQSLAAGGASIVEMQTAGRTPLEPFAQRIL